MAGVWEGLLKESGGTPLLYLPNKKQNPWGKYGCSKQAAWIYHDPDLFREEIWMGESSLDLDELSFLPRIHVI